MGRRMSFAQQGQTEKKVRVNGSTDAEQKGLLPKWKIGSLLNIKRKKK